MPLKVHFIEQRAQEKYRIKCSNPFSDLSRKFQKWFTFYWCRPLKMDLSWLGNTFFDTSGVASIREFSSKKEQITNKTYLLFLAFHPFTYFTFPIFSRDWFDSKQIRSNSEKEREKRQLWKIPTSWNAIRPQDIPADVWSRRWTLVLKRKDLITTAGSFISQGNAYLS